MPWQLYLGTRFCFVNLYNISADLLAVSFSTFIIKWLSFRLPERISGLCDRAPWNLTIKFANTIASRMNN
jgi:hypothetical protein